ncbi:amidohydrolase 3 [Aspergillus venezuelensis]
MKTLYRNALIASVSESETATLLVENDTIAYIGPEQDAPKNQDQTVDLGGRRVLPGFIDGHMHLLLFGSSLSKISLDNCTSIFDIRSAISAGAATRPASSNPRLFCSGWMHSMTNGLALASMIDDLDERPIFIDAKDLHSAWCNGAALRDLGVDNDTPDPEGGFIERDSEGYPTGLLSEAAAVTIVWPHVARVATDNEKRGFVLDAIKAYNAAGYTGMAEMATDENIWAVARQLYQEGEEEVFMRLACHWIIFPAKEEKDVLAQVDRAIALHKQFNKKTSPNFRIAGIKVICDGVVDACTAALTEPYSTNGASPAPLWEFDILSKVVQRADAAGLQCALHAIGDQAVQLAINALETVAPPPGSPSKRHRIEHLELTSPGDAKRLAELGITASIQPVHADPAILRAWPKLLGPERVKRAFAYREFLESGANVAIGTDSPTAPHHPLRNLYTATTRRSAREPECTEVVNEGFKLSLQQALSAATRGSAYSCFADDVVGTLEVGKKADFVVLERDGPWKAEGLLDVNVAETYFGGRRVFPSA